MKRRTYLMRCFIALEIVLAFGFTLYSIILIILNKNMNPTDIARAGQEAYMVRYNWLKAADRIITSFKIVYNVGIIIIALVLLRRKAHLSIRVVLLYPIFQLLLMVLCTGLFAIFDRAYWGNYFFPIWPEIAVIIEITTVYLIAIGIRQGLKIVRHRKAI